ncbi:MAG: hypothetical protein SNG02_05730 [Rikenellaceae bacterium]
MNRETLAAIDIGSNAIRLLISYIEKNGSVTFKRAAFIRVPIRLGEDVFTQGYIGEDKKNKLMEAMASFRHLMNTFNVKAYRACATSAMREAKNREEVVAYIRQKSNIDIEIISGTEEAETIFEAGGIAGLMGRSESYLYVDVGGGSTEVTIYSNRKRVDSRSFPLGTVRSISNAVDSDEYQNFKRWLKEVALIHKPVAIIGSGGNINKVHKILYKKDKESIRYVELKLLYDHIVDMTDEQRMKNMGLNPYRADVIVPAMKIFITVAKVCKIDEVMVPKVGLADGVVNHLYNQLYPKK